MDPKYSSLIKIFSVMAIVVVISVLGIYLGSLTSTKIKEANPEVFLQAPVVTPQVICSTDFVLNTPTPTPSNTPIPTDTPLPTATSIPTPTATATLVPTNTPTPTLTATPLPTATNTPLPTATLTPMPTLTSTPLPTATSIPTPTTTATLAPTETPTPAPTATVTATPLPTATSTPMPTATPAPLYCKGASASTETMVSNMLPVTCNFASSTVDITGVYAQFRVLDATGTVQSLASTTDNISLLQPSECGGQSSCAKHTLNVSTLSSSGGTYTLQCRFCYSGNICSDW